MAKDIKGTPKRRSVGMSANHHGRLVAIAIRLGHPIIQGPSGGTGSTLEYLLSLAEEELEELAKAAVAI